MSKKLSAAFLISFFLSFFPAGCNSAHDAGDSTAPQSNEQPSAQNPADLVPFSEPTADGDRYGYRDADGQVRIKPRFRLANDFSESGLAAVVDETGWAYIDSSGQVVIHPFVFDNGPDPFSDGLARFEREGKFGFFDEQGKVAIEPRFDFASSFSEGLAAACMGCVRVQDGEHWTVSGGKWGYINRSGDEAIPFAFDEAGPFEGGSASVVEAGESKRIGMDGHPAQ